MTLDALEAKYNVLHRFPGRDQMYNFVVTEAKTKENEAIACMDAQER